MNRRTALKALAGSAAGFLLPFPLSAAKPAIKPGAYMSTEIIRLRTLAECWQDHADGYGPEWAWYTQFPDARPGVLYNGHPYQREKCKDQRPLLWRPTSYGNLVMLPVDNERFHNTLEKAVEYHVEIVHGREITYLRAPITNGSEFDGMLFWGAWDTTVPTRIQCICGLCWTSLGLVREQVSHTLPKYWLPDRPKLD